jgi:hypothetical protein
VAQERSPAVESYEQFLRKYLPNDASRILTESDPETYEPGRVEAEEALERSLSRFQAAKTPERSTSRRRVAAV